MPRARAAGKGRMDRRRRSLPLIAAAAGLLALAGCTTAQPAPPPTGAPAVTNAAPIATPTGPAPTMVAGGGAAENKPYFDYVNQRTLAADPKAGSHAIVDALAAAGFSKEDMEVTFDRTSVDLEADYIIVSVKLGGQCLIGQRVAGAYASEIAAPISTGDCLIGRTQPIDW